MIEMAKDPAATLMRLTRRDRALIEVLGEVRYLTAAQIQQVCYPSASADTTRHRLSLLKKRGVLTYLAHRAFEDRRAFWGLSPAGRTAAEAVAAAEQGAPAAAAPRAVAVAALQIEHLIATNQVFCDLCGQHRAGRLGAFRWLGSHHAQVDLEDTRLVPDALILMGTPDGGVWMYCLELDQGTMAPLQLSAKFARYRRFHDIANLRRDEPVWGIRASSWVVFACKDSARAACAAQLAVRAGLERIWAGTAAEVAAGLAASVGPETVIRLGDLPPGLTGGIVPPCMGGALPVDERETRDDRETREEGSQ